MGDSFHKLNAGANVATKHFLHHYAMIIYSSEIPDRVGKEGLSSNHLGDI
jgi:hypothetical protein